ncbi:MAG: CHAT domain-containing protein [Blastocatellia bacterium]|nr:CHAT domain-containing protein [Blastocatellia bacterium]
MRASLVCGFAVLFAVGFLFIGVSAQVSQTAADAVPLPADKPLEQELKGGDRHNYTVSLEKGTYLHAVVEQKGIDVLVTVYGPDGAKLVAVDSPNGTQGPEPVYLIAEQSGLYRLEVSSLEKNAPAGRYEAKVVENRPSTAQDVHRLASQRLYAEGMQLRGQRTKAANLKAIAVFTQALGHYAAIDDKSGQAASLNSLGIVSYLLGENQQALDYYGKALPLWEALGKPGGKANVLGNMGVVYRELGETSKALAAYEQTYKLWIEAGERRGQAITLQNISLLHNSLRESEKAADYARRAMKLYEEIGDRQGQANMLNSIGGIHSLRDEHEQALDSFQKALTLQIAIGDRPGQGLAYLNIGAEYHELGDDRKAVDYYQKALPLIVEAGDRSVEATALSNLGSVYEKLEDRPKALEYFTQALGIFVALGNRQGQAITLHGMGNVYSDLKQFQKALDAYDQSLKLTEATGDRGAQAQTLNSIGTVYSRLGNPVKAREYYQKAMPILGQVGARSFQANTLSNLALIERDLGNLAVARTHIEEALKLVEFIRTNSGTQENRASYFATVQRYFQFYVDLLMRLHRADPQAGFDRQALAVSEQARARSLLDLLVESGTDLRQGADPQLIAEEHRLQDQITAKLKDLTKLLTSKHTEAQETEAKQVIETLTVNYRQVQQRIRQTSPRYAALTQPKLVTLKEIQQELDADSMLLEYLLGQEGSYLFAVTVDSCAVFPLPKQEEIEPIARRVYDLLTARNRLSGSPEEILTNIKRADQELGAAAASLSNLILGPVADRLGKKRLLIVADGVLQYIPFGALPNPQGSGFRVQGSGSRVQGQEKTTQSSVLSPQSFPSSSVLSPLLVEHEIVNLPSVSALAILRAEKRAEKRNRTTPAKLLAVLADPVFGGTDDIRVRSLSSQGRTQNGIPELTAANRQTLARLVEPAPASASPAAAAGERGVLFIRRLPASRLEAESISGLASQAETLKALDFSATRALAMSDQMSQYRFVHFATHGLLDADHPELSALVLSLIDQEGKPQDGFLRVFDLYNLNFPAEVVTLSACKTGLGKEVRGEGLIGMTRGFMYAGASRVVVSLWNVEDKSTAELMKEFYQNMLGPARMTPAAALRAAQLAMWKKKRWEMPYYWAAFVIQGEPR